MKSHENKEFKAFLVVMNPKRVYEKSLADTARSIARQGKVSKAGVTYLADPKDQSISDYKINTNPLVKNTVFVYRDKAVVAKFVNLAATPAGLIALDKAIAQITR